MTEMKQNTMAKAVKTQRGKKKSPVSNEHRKKIVRAYYQLYRVFVLKNLLSGMTLGAASHNAMQLVRAKISTMDKNNPVTKYLMRINARHAKRVAKRAMTSKYRNARATTKPETRARITKLMPKWMAFSLNTFATMSALYKPKTNANTTVIPKQATLLQIQIASQHQHVA
jgi:glutamine synthetase adenylyltransferase